MGVAYLAVHSLWVARPAVYGMSTGIQRQWLIPLFLIPTISNRYCYRRAGCSDQGGRCDSDWGWCDCRCGSRGNGRRNCAWERCPLEQQLHKGISQRLPIEEGAKDDRMCIHLVTVTVLVGVTLVTAVLG